MTENKFRERRSAFRDESEEPSARVEAPTAELETADPEPPPPHPDAVTAEPPVAAEPLPDSDLEQLAAMEVPPPSFFDLVEPHVEMALRFLGQLPLTPEGDRQVLPQWAKREIDLLGILEARTRNNLPAEERQALEQALDQLRTLYLRLTP